MRFLSPEEEQELRSLHRKESDSRVCDRIKAVLLSNDGWTYIMIAKALMIDEKTASKHVFDYKVSKKLKIESGGSVGKLNEAQKSSLILHLESILYTKIQDICIYVEKTYGVKYTESGMRNLMRSNDFVYKKPKGFPAKACPIAQAKFIEDYI